VKWNSTLCPLVLFINLGWMKASTVIICNLCMDIDMDESMTGGRKEDAIIIAYFIN
jgi:hypothetical protein